MAKLNLFYDCQSGEVVHVASDDIPDSFVDLARLRRQIEERLRLDHKLVIAMAKLLKLI